MENLTKAFKELRKQKIFARQNFWCCQSCACADIDTSVDKQKYIGYVYYHQQDGQSKKEGKNFFLAFGSINDDDKISQEVGQKIVDTLIKHGVITCWNGNTGTRIMVVQEINEKALV